jgi:hypothetical protein
MKAAVAWALVWWGRKWQRKEEEKNVGRGLVGFFVRAADEAVGLGMWD